VGLVLAGFTVALLEALSAFRQNPPVAFDLVTPLHHLLAPAELTGWLTTVGVVACGIIAGLLTAAVAAARHGAGQELAEEDEDRVEGE
jgi:hypothetical protein